MIAWLRRHGINKDKDCYVNALVDWVVLGLHTGYRDVEWCQQVDPTKHGYYEYETITKWKNQIYACCPGDLNFMGSTTGQLSGLEHQPTAWEIARDTPIGELAATKIRWRYQKNLFHGEEIDFVANPDSDFCPVIATKNIVERHQRLNMGADTPLAVYKRNKNSIHGTHFVKNGVEKQLKDAAWQVYYPELELKHSPAKITLHSIRIGACVLLHSVNPNALFIKSRLRWRSDKFENCIRHVPALAAQHGRAMQRANVSSYGLTQVIPGFTGANPLAP